MEKIGIIICFWFSEDMFMNMLYYYDILVKCFCEFLFLNFGVLICFKDECDGKEDYFMYEGGIQVFVEYLN